MTRRLRSPLPWLGALLALYLLAPIAVLLGGLGAHGAAGAPGLGAALATSALTATVSAAVIALLGIPLAWVLARTRGPLAGALGVAVQLPLALPPLMSGILLLAVVGPHTALGELFGGRLTDSAAGIVLAQTFVAAPFLVVAARSSFAALDPALDDVAASLGHGPLARFARVALPAAAPGIGAGLLLAWLRAFGEFGATVILAYHPFSLPVYTFVQFDSGGVHATVLPVAASLATAVVLLAAAAAGAPALRRLRRPRPVAAPRPHPPEPRPAAPLDLRLERRLGDFALALSHQALSPRLAVLGPSGAGKTVTLRLLAGLLRPDAGHLRAGGVALDRLPAERREIGYVPQHAALLPRRRVWDQVTFGRGADPAVAAWWLERLGLAELADRRPDELSGGQQRRVALARALAVRPRLLLLDEPFAGLDAPVRDKLRRELRRLQHEASLSTVLVTHDPEEAALLADEILVVDGGRLVQAGERTAVFQRPASPRVAGLLGIANAGEGRVEAPGRLRAGGAVLDAPTGELEAGTAVSWSIRPEAVRLDGRGEHAATVLDCADLGSTREVVVAVDGGLELTVRTAAPAGALGPGDRCRLEVPADAVSVWPREGEAAQPSTARMTSEALMTAVTSLPSPSPSSSTASTVIEATSR